MTAFKRWQDWTVVLAGIVLVAAPYVFGETGNATALWATGIIGVAIVLVGLMAAAPREANAMEWLPGLAGIVAFLAPWLFGYTDLAATSWASWIIGAVVVLAAGEVTFEARTPSTHMPAR